MNAQQVHQLYLRNLIADAVEALVAVLDALDPDPDLESGCDDEDVNEDGRDDSLDGGATEHGIADKDALDSEELCFRGFGFDGSGKRIARRQLRGLPI